MGWVGCVCVCGGGGGCGCGGIERIFISRYGELAGGGLGAGRRLGGEA